MTYRKLCFLVFCALAPGLILSSAASATLLTNGSFETATDDGYGHMVPDGWGVYVTNLEWENVDHQQTIDGTAQDGLAYWMLDDHSTGTGVLLGIQDVGTLADITYTFDIWLRDPVADGGTAQIGYEFWDATNTTWWGVDFSAPFTLTTDWQKFSHTVTKWADSYMKVQIKVDNNVIHADNATLIPEPTTMVLLGLGSLMMLRRRRHQ